MPSARSSRSIHANPACACSSASSPPSAASTAKRIALGECKSVQLRAGSVANYLGPARFEPEHVYAQDEVGLVRGLAWTSVGGEVLDVEAAVLDGTGKLELTGNLGDVMKESAQAAVTYIRSRAQMLGIDPEFYKKKDIHIHFPGGADPRTARRPASRSASRSSPRSRIRRFAATSP